MTDGMCIRRGVEFVHLCCFLGYRYTGKERDAESGNDYFGARYMASSMGRFMSPDPINLTEDRLLNPSNTLNKYAYGANNPLKYVDHDHVLAALHRDAI